MRVTFWGKKFSPLDFANWVLTAIQYHYANLPLESEGEKLNYSDGKKSY